MTLKSIDTEMWTFSQSRVKSTTLNLSDQISSLYQLVTNQVFQRDFWYKLFRFYGVRLLQQVTGSSWCLEL